MVYVNKDEREQTNEARKRHEKHKNNFSNFIQDHYLNVRYHSMCFKHKLLSQRMKLWSNANVC